MNIEDFREMGSCKKVLKVASLAFDNTFFPMDMLKDSCNITMFVLTVAAIDIYLRSAPTTEPSHIYALMDAVSFLVRGAGLICMTKWAFIKLAKFAESVELALQEIREKHNKLEQEQVKQDIQPELPPINEELLAEYMSAEFRGLGGHHNYMPQFLKDLEKLRKERDSEIMRVATLLYESKALACEPKNYKQWVEDFFNILGKTPPSNPSRTKSMPSKQIINQYYYIDMPNN